MYLGFNLRKCFLRKLVLSFIFGIVNLKILSLVNFVLTSNEFSTILFNLLSVLQNVKKSKKRKIKLHLILLFPTS